MNLFSNGKSFVIKAAQSTKIDGNTWFNDYDCQPAQSGGGPVPVVLVGLVVCRAFHFHFVSTNGTSSPAHK